jgi:hypothetical protein
MLGRTWTSCVGELGLHVLLVAGLFLFSFFFLFFVVCIYITIRVLSFT